MMTSPPWPPYSSGDADPVEARLGELVPELERVLVLLALELARLVLRALAVDPGPGLAPKELELLGQLEVEFRRHDGGL